MDQLRAAGAVVIVGAGASIEAGYPLTRLLPPHLWKAIDADPGVLRELMKRLNRDAISAKALIGDDDTALRHAYELVKASPVARMEFQQSFQALDQARTASFSPAHDALAELLHRRAVETVISLNWDTMLEAAYRRRYARILRPDGSWLHKPHGDAADSSSPWVLPNEPGVVPDALVEQINAFVADRPRLLLIVGYSESDEAMVQRLIRPIEARWRVVRIGPNASGALAIPLGADEALPRIRQSLVGESSEAPGWEYVTFSHQNDLGAALDGRGLGPSDVSACPRLPEVSIAAQTIRAAHSVVVEGEPGSGKSMVAYHIAFDLCAEGWEVLRLVDPAHDRMTLLGALDGLPAKTLVLVDNAQTVAPALLRAIRERARPDMFVLLVTNTHPGDTRGVVHVAGEQAVRALAAALRARRAETLAVVRRFDPHVGDGWGDTRLEDMFSLAEQAHLPWQFSFILTGGERRALGHLTTLADSDRADLLLAVIGARQVATTDLGVTHEELATFASAIGRDAEWLKRSLLALHQHRLVVGTDRLRCPHQRYALAALRIVFRTRKEPAWSQLLSIVRHAILDGDPPLSGIALLLRELWFADAFPRGWRENTIIDGEAWSRLTARCVAASTPTERGGAGFLLESLEGYHADWEAWLLDHASTIGRWITEATAESAWGVSMFANELTRLPKVAPSVYVAADPEKVAESVNVAPLSEAYTWAHLLGRVAFAGDEWRARLRARLLREHFLDLANETTATDAHYVCAFAEGILSYDRELGLEMIELASPQIAARMSEDFPEAYSEFSPVWDHVLGFVGVVLDIGKLSPRQKNAMRGIVKRVDLDAAAGSIMRAPRGSLSNSGRLLSYIGMVDKRYAKRIAERIDFERLEETTSGLWEQPPGELVEFVSSVAFALGDYGPVQAWLSRHEAEFRTFPARFAAIAPDVALRAFGGGARIELGIAAVLGWALPTHILNELAERDEAAARSVAKTHVDEMAKEFRIPQKNQCEHLDYFVGLLQQVAPDALAAALDQIEPATVRDTWAARLRGGRSERRAASALIKAALSAPRLREIALDLQERFPAALTT